MDPWSYLPSDLRTPWGPERRQLHWRSDLGQGVTADRLAAYLLDLQTLLDCGQRWGQVFAEIGARRAFDLELRETGSLNFDGEDQDFWEAFFQQLTSEYPDFEKSPPRFGYGAFVDAGISNLLARSTETLLGQPAVIRRLTYQNPLSLDVEGSGLAFRGVDALISTVLSLRRRRSERSEQRYAEGAARIRAAEAEARYFSERAEQARAETRIRVTQADLYEMYALGVRSGRYPIVPPGDLSRLVTAPDLAAIDRLDRLGFEASEG